MSLKEYKEKRNFDLTSEPKGKVKNSSKILKFVIQYHQARAKHYDFRLEFNGVLLSWAVPKGLSENPKDKRLAVRVEDHPIDYITFEGIIPKGNYGAGSVEIFDKGNYLPLDDFEKGLKKGHIKFVLNGEKYKGGWSLIRIEDNNWLIIKEKDEFASEKITKKSTKIPFDIASPQLATLTNTIPKGKDWLFEIKYDGYRIITYFENGKIKMLTRNNQDYTKKFEKIAKSIKNLKQNSFVLDGEVVVFDKNGRTDFGLLQKNIKTKEFDFYYVIFDILALNGEDFRELPLIKRKEKLELLLAKAEQNLIFSTFVINKGQECFNIAKEKNLEGIIAKNINSKYIGKRDDNWLKIKCYLRQEFVIGGFTISDRNEYLSAILVGYYWGEDFIFVGKVGTGFNNEQKKELNTQFKKLIAKKCPFSSEINEKNVTWLKPKLVTEIQFTELTKDNLLRQPSFISIRTDKQPKDIKLEVADSEK